MRKFIVLCSVFFIYCASIPSSFGTEYWKANLKIMALQATGPSANTSYEGVFWVQIENSNWSPANCPADWHSVDATTHPHVVALLINAFS